MTTAVPAVSDAFRAFLAETPAHGQAVDGGAVEGLGATSALDEKTRHLAYLAVLAAMRLTDGLPLHVDRAKAAGASRDEGASAIPIGLPAAGNGVVHALPPTLAAFDGV